MYNDQQNYFKSTLSFLKASESKESDGVHGLSFAKNQSGQKLLCCNAFISVMEAAELWNGDNLSNIQHLSRKRTLLAQAQVSSRFMVVAEVRRQRSLEVAGVQNDVVVEAVPSDRANESLGVWILPGAFAVLSESPPCPAI